MMRKTKASSAQAMLPIDRIARWVLIAVTAFSILLLIGPSLIVIAI